MRLDGSGSELEQEKINTVKYVISSEGSPMVSLCMPTNGVSKWVFPVLDSIYCQNVENSKFEVVVVDNGNNDEFEAQMRDYAKKHSNITYAKTNAYEFLSEIETYKCANGELIKFVNHRTKLVAGFLQKIIEFAEENKSNKPIIYYTNGVLKCERKEYRFETFDQFVKKLSYWSSWSTGMTFWKTDFESIDLSEPNVLFPHTSILFAKRNRNLYIVDNSVVFDEIPTGTSPKGKYNLFNAFAVEYVDLILQLFREGDINLDTFFAVKQDNLEFVSSLFWEYIIKKNDCSYDLSNYRKSIDVFYNMKDVRTVALKIVCGKIFRRFRIKK